MDWINIHLPRPVNIFLKSRERAKNGLPVDTGVLMDPVIKGNCDADLYAEVRANGKAVVVKFKRDNPFDMEEPVEMTPKEFERVWMGD